MNISINSDDLILIAIDNQPAGRALAKRWSGNSETDLQCDRLNQLISPKNLAIVDIDTSLNVADSPSRGDLSLSPIRYSATFNTLIEAYKQYSKGFTWIERPVA